MDLRELNKKLEQIDNQIAQKNVPLLRRPFDTFGILCPNGGVLLSPRRDHLFADFEGPNLFRKINEWYDQRYGDKMLLHPKIGEKPFKLRGHVYYTRYPVVYGRVLRDILKYVPALT